MQRRTDLTGLQLLCTLGIVQRAGLEPLKVTVERVQGLVLLAAQLNQLQQRGRVDAVEQHHKVAAETADIALQLQHLEQVCCQR